MAKSNAKKQRDKLSREGRRNPEAGRSPFVFTDMRTRKTKTKHEKMYLIKHKNQVSRGGDEGSFYFAYISRNIDHKAAK
ncbi:hypothetical protein [Paenibacillus sp. SN-8-1]|uniref:hypothetical protein n=1 Tax=Paenibacillus sp. SN-8-1 TaxID=3435409 RepID=UPI003D9A31A7